MTKYIQTNELGYIVSLTDESLLTSLFGGDLKNYKQVSDDEAEFIQKLLDACHSRGEGLHIDDIVHFKK